MQNSMCGEMQKVTQLCILTVKHGDSIMVTLFFSQRLNENAFLEENLHST